MFCFPAFTLSLSQLASRGSVVRKDGADAAMEDGSGQWSVVIASRTTIPVSILAVGLAVCGPSCAAEKAANPPAPAHIEVFSAGNCPPIERTDRNSQIVHAETDQPSAGSV
jgi:hypothetical protein